ncbi:MAG: site-specific integrase [Nitrospirae bacterium]|nr:site-specific integrase [Nitrospirota bacterium]
MKRLLLAEMLERYIHGPICDNTIGDYAPLFPGRYIHRPLSFRQAQARFDKWKNIAGIRKGLTIHSFRAGFATLLYRVTGDILLVARAMGHSDVRSTDRYVGNNMPAIREAMGKTFMVR